MEWRHVGGNSTKMAEQGEARSFSDDATDTALAIDAPQAFSLTLSHFVFLSPHSIQFEGFARKKIKKGEGATGGDPRSLPFAAHKATLFPAPLTKKTHQWRREKETKRRRKATT